MDGLAACLSGSPACLSLHQDYINHSPSVVALLVSGTSQTHSILAHHGKRREILVIITGVESDYEVMTRGIGPPMTSPTPDHAPPPWPLQLLALASRFARWPDVEVTLLIVQEDEQGPPPLDQRLLRALEDFRCASLWCWGSWCRRAIHECMPSSPHPWPSLRPLIAHAYPTVHSCSTASHLHPTPPASM